MFHMFPGLWGRGIYVLTFHETLGGEFRKDWGIMVLYLHFPLGPLFPIRETLSFFLPTPVALELCSCKILILRP